MRYQQHWISIVLKSSFRVHKPIKESVNAPSTVQYLVKELNFLIHSSLSVLAHLCRRTNKAVVATRTRAVEMAHRSVSAVRMSARHQRALEELHLQLLAYSCEELKATDPNARETNLLYKIQNVTQVFRTIYKSVILKDLCVTQKQPLEFIRH